jgi:hypothetical protein
MIVTAHINELKYGRESSWIVGLFSGIIIMLVVYLLIQIVRFINFVKYYCNSCMNTLFLTRGFYLTSVNWVLCINKKHKEIKSKQSLIDSVHFFLITKKKVNIERGAPGLIFPEELFIYCRFINGIKISAHTDSHSHSQETIFRFLLYSDSYEERKLCH